MNRSYALFLIPLLFAAPVQAASATRTESRVVTSTQVPPAELPVEQAKAWGLTDLEWSRFETIKAGPRGYWSPHLDPLTALGVEAQNDAERQRYAELQVRLEAQRAERELAYQNAYTAAWARLYPGLLPIQGLADRPRASPLLPRLAVFVEADCAACLAQASQLQARDTPFDLFLVGSQGEDQRLRDWARLAGLEPGRVQRKQITLNHDQGQWSRLGIQGPLPASVQRVGGQWQRIE